MILIVLLSLARLEAHTTSESVDAEGGADTQRAQRLVNAAKPNAPPLRPDARKARAAMPPQRADTIPTSAAVAPTLTAPNAAANAAPNAAGETERQVAPNDAKKVAPKAAPKVAAKPAKAKKATKREPAASAAPKAAASAAPKAAANAARTVATNKAEKAVSNAALKANAPKATSKSARKATLNAAPRGRFAVKAKGAKAEVPTAPKPFVRHVPEGDTYTYSSASRCDFHENGKGQCCGSASRIVIDSSVVEIEAHAFAHCHSVRIVDFSEAAKLQRIGEGAFRAAGTISAIDLRGAAKLATVGAYAFSGCDSLATLYLPASVSKVERSAFQNSALKSYCSVEWGTVDCAAVSNGEENVFEFKCSALPCTAKKDEL